MLLPMFGGMGLGLLFVGLVVFALLPASSTDPRSRALALLQSVTPSPTITASPTFTPSPTTTPIPTATAVPTEMNTTTPTLIPSATDPGTPTPGPTPDSRDRSFWVPILMYHYVSVAPPDADIYRQDLSVSPQVFEQQVNWLQQNGYTAISIEQLVYALNIGWPPLPDKPVILTFDDGYEDNYTNAFPILQKYGMTGTFFILTDVTDRSQPGYMTWNMLREMHEGGMSIQVHGREHVEYINRDPSWLLFNLQGPAETIQAELGYTPRVFCYPAGLYDQAIMDALPQYGYWAAVSTEHGAQHEKTDRYEFDRIRVRGEWTVQTFAAVVSG